MANFKLFSFNWNDSVKTNKLIIFSSFSFYSLYLSIKRSRSPCVWMWRVFGQLNIHSKLNDIRFKEISVKNGFISNSESDKMKENSKIILDLLFYLPMGELSAQCSGNQVPFFFPLVVNIITNCRHAVNKQVICTNRKKRLNGKKKKINRNGKIFDVQQRPHQSLHLTLINGAESENLHWDIKEVRTEQWNNISGM